VDSFNNLDQNSDVDQTCGEGGCLRDEIDNLLRSLEMHFRPLTKNLVRLPEIPIPEVGGSVIKRLERLLIGFSKNFKEFKKIGVKVPGGILLHGPVGVGKTRLALSLLQKHDLNTLTVKPSQIFSKYLSESEENIVQLFRKASECAPCVIFFDEIDVYGSKRGI
jgi:SpoVK/Ycf46/Vps4 family AAA+-type ATPase